MVIGGLLSVISSRDKIELVDQRFFAIDITERSGKAVPSIKHKHTHTHAYLVRIVGILHKAGT